ncbi:MAG: hydantoinase B/oxoprolinase family protein, partial [Pseudomonadota bacterium]
AYSEIRRKDGRVEEIRSKIVTQLEAGDRVLVKTPGGGGYGDPRKRERSAVKRDIENGKISGKTAREVYGLDTL